MFFITELGNIWQYPRVMVSFVVQPSAVHPWSKPIHPPHPALVQVWTCWLIRARSHSCNRSCDSGVSGPSRAEAALLLRLVPRVGRWTGRNSGRVMGMHFWRRIGGGPQHESWMDEWLHDGWSDAWSDGWTLLVWEIDLYSLTRWPLPGGTYPRTTIDCVA